MNLKPMAEMPINVWAATLAAMWARKLGLGSGNYWEPPVTRWLSELVAEGFSRDQARTLAEGQLGLGGEPA